MMSRQAEGIAIVGLALVAAVSAVYVYQRLRSPLPGEHARTLVPAPIPDMQPIFSPPEGLENFLAFVEAEEAIPDDMPLYFPDQASFPYQVTDRQGRPIAYFSRYDIERGYRMTILDASWYWRQQHAADGD